MTAPLNTPVRVLDDLAKVANGAVSTVVGMKHEIDQLVRQRVEKLLTHADLVPREEFDAVQAMAAEARAEQDRLEKRVAALEAKLAGAAKPARRAKPAAGTKAAAKKTRAKTAPAKKTRTKKSR